MLPLFSVPLISSVLETRVTLSIFHIVRTLMGTAKTSSPVEAVPGVTPLALMPLESLELATHA